MLVAVYDTLKEAGYDTAAVFGLDGRKGHREKEEMQTFTWPGVCCLLYSFCLLVYMFTGEKI